MKSAARILMSVENRRSLAAEQFRTLRTNIQFSKAKSELKSIVVTSAVQEEGKSTTVANLACMFAETGKKVLFIDADLRRPTAHFTFEMNNLKGLTNILVDQEINWSIIKETKIDNLSLLSSGTIPPNPAKLLDGLYFNEMLQEFYTKFDLVIIDSPPILAVTDTQLILNNVSASILVVNIEKTDKKIVQKANLVLKASDASYLGVVINNMNSNVSDYNNSSYYASYYDED